MIVFTLWLTGESLDIKGRSWQGQLVQNDIKEKDIFIEFQRMSFKVSSRNKYLREIALLISSSISTSSMVSYYKNNLDVKKESWIISNNLVELIS